MKNLLAGLIVLMSASAFADCVNYTIPKTTREFPLCATKSGNVLSGPTIDWISLKATEFNAEAVCKAFGYSGFESMTKITVDPSDSRANLKNGSSTEVFGFFFPAHALGTVTCNL